MDKASSKRENMAIPSAIPFSNLSNESISEMTERKIVDIVKIASLIPSPY
jgi:hypothetical protein